MEQGQDVKTDVVKEHMYLSKDNGILSGRNQLQISPTLPFMELIELSDSTVQPEQKMTEQHLEIESNLHYLATIILTNMKWLVNLLQFITSGLFRIGSYHACKSCGY